MTVLTYLEENKSKTGSQIDQISEKSIEKELTFDDIFKLLKKNPIDRSHDDLNNLNDFFKSKN